MRLVPHLPLAALALVPALAVAQTSGAQVARAGPLCGSGTFLLHAGGDSLGRETFEMRCSPGAFAGSGRTRLTLPSGMLDLETSIELDSTLVPRRLTAKGTAGSTTIDQTVEIRRDSATVTTSGATRQIPYPSGASHVPSNVFYQTAYLLARYDSARGGTQAISVAAPVPVTLDRHTPDTLAGENGGRLRVQRFSLRVGPQRIVLFTDPAGRLAAVVLPSQRFSAVREEHAPFRDAMLESASALAASAAASAAAPVDYSAPAGAPFTAEEVTVPVAGGRYTLAGTLLLPKGGRGPWPAAVTITGSGQQTRDAALPIEGLEQYRPMRQIAERLASRGIAVLRVDDRGTGRSTGRETLGAATTSSFADDVRAQLTWLRARRDIDPARIALVGHSEGGSIAPMVAAGDSRVAALVLLAALGKTGALTSVEQVKSALRTDTTMTEAEKRELLARQERAVQAVVAGDSIVEGQIVPAWTREYLHYDPLPTIRRVRQPILIVQGERDQQVDASNAALLAEAARAAGNRDVTVRLFPALNHLLLPARTGAVAEYSKLETQTVGDDVLTAITDWLTARLRKK